MSANSSEAIALIARGATEIVSEEELRKKLARGTPLIVKAGFDPTAPDIHLGHTVLLHKMRHFQELGHRVVFLIGDFTGLIGDPSGRNATRPMATAEELEENARTYAEQAFKVLDPEKTELRRNSEWFGKMSAADMIRLASQHTVARMLERDDFSKRMAEHRPISVHEFLYPLVQGHDSVALDADIELGGTDQKFNLLVGRELQRDCGKEPQCVLTMPLLEGLDGQRKMSKSLGNHIGINEDAASIYGKVMSVSDELMWRYYELLSFKDTAEIGRMRRETTEGKNPMEAKKQLAGEITARFCGEKEATAAAEAFTARFSRGEIPDEMPESRLPANPDGCLPLTYALKQAGLVPSSSEGRRKIAAGAVRLDGERISDPERQLRRGDQVVAQVGKRRFAKISVE